MKFYTKQHQFYCGIDLHANAMYICIIDSSGEVVVHKNILTKPKSFLRLIKPYRNGLVVGCECMFSVIATGAQIGQQKTCITQISNLVGYYVQCRHDSESL